MEAKWNYDTCLAEAKKYKSVTEFHKGSKGAYKKAWQNGWLSDYTFFVNPRQIWTEETCLAEAKKYEYKKDFKDNNGSAYGVARTNGWLKDYTWLKNKSKPKGYWTRENCFIEAKKYKDYTKFATSVAGQVAQKNGWITEYDWLQKKHEANGYWTKEKCLEEARKFDNMVDFAKSSSGAYGAARRNNWMDEIWALGIWERKCMPNNYWNEERCYDEAKKYSSRWEFEQNCPAAKHNAMINGWIDTYAWFSTPQHALKWDYDACYAEAQKYDNVWDFHNSSSGAYKRAYEQKWLYGFKWLFANSNHNSRNFKFNLLEEFVDEYHLREWLTNVDINIVHIILRNLAKKEPEFSPIIKDITKLVNSGSDDPIKDLEDKYRKPEEESNEAETEATTEVTVENIDLDDDEAVEAVIESINGGKKEETEEPSIEDITKANEVALHIVTEIEHMLTPEDKQYLKGKFLNDKRREWMKNRDII